MATSTRCENGEIRYLVFGFMQYPTRATPKFGRASQDARHVDAQIEGDISSAKTRHIAANGTRDAEHTQRCASSPSCIHLAFLYSPVWLMSLRRRQLWWGGRDAQYWADGVRNACAIVLAGHLMAGHVGLMKLDTSTQRCSPSQDPWFLASTASRDPVDPQAVLPLQCLLAVPLHFQEIRDSKLPAPKVASRS